MSTSSTGSAEVATARCAELASIFQDPLLEEPLSASAPGAVQRMGLMNTAQAAGQIGLIDPRTGPCSDKMPDQERARSSEDRQFRIYRRGYPSLADNLRGRATHGQKSRSA